MSEGDWFIYDPDPPGEPGPCLYGPYPTKANAEAVANALHPDDESGNTVVLRARLP